MSLENKMKDAKPSDWLSAGLSTDEIAETQKLALIAAKIQLKRLEMGLNQKDFAKYMGVSQGMVSRWESGEYNFTITTLNEICNRLNLKFSLSITSKTTDSRGKSPLARSVPTQAEP